ncbi:exported hypothetical protein [Frankia canadensis]|uniref:Uncharacterized protein n=2 Tax=Frankia canadensis TaxID=1836972 RepID=A0A2I2L1T6_9ACTN|nr:exported hypothetical protein [Frankia canadensis]SOU59158.1 exported hypothetical protein [Frankia canadensis]
MRSFTRRFAAAAILALTWTSSGLLAGSASAETATSCPPASTLASTGYSTTVSGDLYLLDINRLKVTGTVPGFVGAANGYVSRDGRSVYIDNWGAGAVQVLNACTRQVTTTINTNGRVLGVMSPDGRYLYEVGYQGLFETGQDTTLYVIDTTTNAIVRTWPVKDAFAVTVSPDGRKLYVGGVNEVYVFDTAGHQLGTLSTGYLPEWLAITPDGTTLVSSNYDGTATLTRLATGTRVATINYGEKSAPEYVTITPDGTQAWVTLGIGGVGVINLATNTSKVLPTSGMALTVSFSRDSQKAFVTEAGPNTVNTDGIAASERMVSGTWHPGPGNVRVFSVPTQRVLATITTGEFPGVVAIKP